jgi:hypothetical protein
MINLDPNQEGEGKILVTSGSSQLRTNREYIINNK